MAFSRRELLRAGVPLTMVGLAGCSSNGNGGSGGGSTTAPPTQASTTRRQTTQSTTQQSTTQQQQQTDTSDSACESPVEVSGTITEDTTWDCDRYHMTGDVTVANGATLTVDSTVVDTAADTLLSVGDGATLVSTGTAELPTVFRSETHQPGSWKGIEVTAGSVEASFDNTIIRFGGAGGWANVYLQNGATAAFHRCMFDRSSTYGVHAEANTGFTSFSDCSFLDNQSGSMRIPATAIPDLELSTTYTNNNLPGKVVVDNETVTQDATWPAIDRPYVFPDGATIAAGVAVEAGTLCWFGQGSLLSVERGGVLDARGEAASPVRFVGEQTGTPGFWRGIEIVSNDRNSLSNTLVAGGGADGWANVYVQNGGRVSIDNTSLVGSATYGLHAEANTTLSTFEGVGFTRNQQGSMRIPLPSLGRVGPDTVFVDGGGENHIEVTDETVTQPARWNLPDVPVHFPGNGRIRADVTVDPGATFTFAQGSLLSVEQGGSLHAVGGSAADETITFRGDADVPGFWRGIEFVSLSPDNVLDSCEIANGGNGGWANVYVQSSGMATVQNSTLRDSSTAGIIAEDGASLTESGNTFSGNADGPIA
ncbi:right-handed parallel beta-helix repeat-containing protein [Haloarchaeobius salinus]|uniref:right-handed parallel beta-helix repeat-containing protein n=1 Tax=Haloarchaeobius salinus TaxID=1198298 RepID=UPI00210E8D9A|nr:right-handed parallel beta-helix repeat-containing protein [Haloarchaeobius salinus]